LAFVVLEDATGQSVIGPLSLHDGRSAPPLDPLSVPEDTRLLLLGMNEPALRELHPFPDLDRLKEAALVVPSAECPEGEVTGRGEQAIGPPPGSIELWTWEGGGVFELSEDPTLDLSRTGLSLALPLDQDACPSFVEPGLRPFAASAEVATRSLSSAIPMTDGLVLAAYDDNLLLIEAGAQSPLATLNLQAELPRKDPETWFVGEIELAPGTPPTFVATMDSHHPTASEGGTRNAIIEVELDLAGSEFSTVRTGTIVNVELNGLTIDDLGRIVVTGDRGTVITATATGSKYQVYQLDQNAPLRHVISTGSPSLPHAIGRTGAVLLGDATRGPSGLTIHDNFATGATIRGLESHVDEDGLWIWVSSSKGLYYERNPQGQWTAHLLPVPAELADVCGFATSCGEQHTDMNLTHVFARPRRGGVDLVFALEICNAAVMLKPDGCTTTLAEEDQPLRQYSSGFFNDVRALRDALTFAGGPDAEDIPSTNQPLGVLLRTELPR
jgi:hypothetical protein